MIDRLIKSAARNISNIDVLPVAGINVYDIMRRHKLVLTRAAVDAFHAAALKSGGRDNGAPGIRADYDANYYAAFVKDPDGYRIEAYCGKP